MEKQTNNIDMETTQQQLPEEWQEKARKAAKQFKLPMPTDQEVGTAEEIEQQLRQAEQEGGE